MIPKRKLPIFNGWQQGTGCVTGQYQVKLLLMILDLNVDRSIISGFFWFHFIEITQKES
jgi:hypothetical protein